MLLRLLLLLLLLELIQYQQQSSINIFVQGTEPGDNAGERLKMNS